MPVHRRTGGLVRVVRGGRVWGRNGRHDTQCLIVVSTKPSDFNSERGSSVPPGAAPGIEPHKKRRVLPSGLDIMRVLRF